MKHFIAILMVITAVCCLAFCEEPSTDPYTKRYEKKATVENVVPVEQPKKKSDKQRDPVVMF